MHGCESSISNFPLLIRRGFRDLVVQRLQLAGIFDRFNRYDYLRIDLRNRGSDIWAGLALPDQGSYSMLNSVFRSRRIRDSFVRNILRRVHDW